MKNKSDEFYARRGYWPVPKPMKPMKNKWNPIETVPHGEKVLMWVTNGYGHDHVKTGIAYPENYPDLKYVSIFDDGDALGYKSELDQCVTHWMPLPKPPTFADL